MGIVIRRFLIVAAVAALACNATAALGGYAENMGLTAVELAQLPKFCWAQMGAPNATGPEFTIEKQKCGEGMNHYCPGLVGLIRAKRMTSIPAKVSRLRGVLDSIAYTEGFMKDYPKCPIRDHVAASKAEVNNLLRIYGGSPAKPK